MGLLQTYSDDGHALGYAPSPVKIPPATSRPSVLLTFPALYDLRSQGRVTPVKDQADCGSCWAFASYGSMESYLLPAETWDFSENNLKNTHGFDWGINDGGNAFMSTAYLARWDGPISEADDPYDPHGTESPPGLPARKHVQEVIYLPPRASSTDNDAIKQAITTYGAVYTSFYWTSSQFNEDNCAYYYSYSGPHPDPTNHAVAIVGWDDNFDKANFNNTPPGNGAFIMKNSWGDSWGQGGYFYMSYYDFWVGNDENASFESAEPTTDFSRVYQYDPLGLVNSLGYEGSSTAWGANIFTAVSRERLAAVSFYTVASDASWEVYVYRNPTSGPINGGSLVSSTTGTIAYAGYYTVPLTTMPVLEAGDRFSVILKLTTPGFGYPLPVEYKKRGYSSAATASAGQSYVSSDGASWSDLTTAWNPTANFCIKAFTLIQRTVSVQSAPTGVAITGTIAGTTDYSAQVDDNSTVDLTAPATITSDDSDYAFVRWTINGAPQPDGLNPISFTVASDTTAHATYTPCCRLSLKAGDWNLVSLSVIPNDPSPQSVFGPNLLGVYAWNTGLGAYFRPTTIECGRGYWVAVGQDTEPAVTGAPSPATSVHLLPGWNLVGPANDSPVPAGGGVLSVFGWAWPEGAPQYVVPDACLEGRGYWVAASAETDIW